MFTESRTQGIRHAFARQWSGHAFLKAVCAAVLCAGILLSGLALSARTDGHDPHITRPDGITPAGPGDYVICVYPYQYPDDFQNVQWAVDNVAPEGTVILKAANRSGQLTPFSFGPSTNSLLIRKSLILQGEALTRYPLESGQPGGWILTGTTIKGGNATRCGVKATPSAPAIRPSVIIRDIIFDGFIAQAISIPAAQGYNEISGCHFRNFVYGVTPGGVSGGFPIIAHGGVTAEAINNLAGILKVKNNFIGRMIKADGSPENYRNNLMHFTCCNLDLEISENEIEDCCWAGIIIAGNKGYSVVSRNKITKTRSYFYEGPAIGVGIYPTNALFVTNDTYEGSAEITDNEIIIGSPADGSGTTNSHAVVIGNYPPTQMFPGFPNLPPHVPVPLDIRYTVSGNRILMYGNPSGKGFNPSAISCVGSASNVTCVDNRVAGEANYGVRLTRILPTGMTAANADAFVENNRFSDNDLDGFKAAIAQVYMDQYSQNNYFGPWNGPEPGQNYDGNFFGSLRMGPAGQPLPLGVYVDNGQGNISQNNDFSQSKLYDQNGELTNYVWGGYVPGWYATPSIGCIWLTHTCSGAEVYEHQKLGTGYFPTGTSMCNQIYSEGTDSLIHQWGIFCLFQPNPNLAEIRARWAAHEQWQTDSLRNPPPEITLPEYQEMTAKGFIWDAMQGWICPSGYGEVNGYCIRK